MKTFLYHLLLIFLFLISFLQCYCWGFYAHQKINYYAVFLLPPEMMVLYKPNILFLSQHAVDPDKRRYGVADEGPRHFIDIDYYGNYPYNNLPHKWSDAIAKFGQDSLTKYGIIPWYIQTMQTRLTNAFKENNFSKILKTSAELGHYVADAHVPLHANSNHNGQLTNQQGIHAFWESRVPELLAEKQFDFFIGKADFIKDPNNFIWKRVLESAKAADSVLAFEKQLTQQFGEDKKYAFEERNGKTIKQYSSSFTIAFNKKLEGMIERRMQQSIYAVASFWYTAWVNAGQPNLKKLITKKFTDEDEKEFNQLNAAWKAASKMIGKQEE